MLETLVAPRIRRTLFEYLLGHPSDRFYLRGLAKDLNLPISPLRRELKRLEQAGMLCTTQEGNMLFYMIEPTSSAFLQLQQAGSPLQRVAPAAPRSTQPILVETHAVRREDVVIAQPQPHASMPLGMNTAKRSHPFWQAALPAPLILATGVVGMALVLIIAGLSYLSMTNQRDAVRAHRALETRTAHATIGAPQPSSGLMRGSRWQIVPGGFGGFSSGTGSEPHSR